MITTRFGSCGGAADVVLEGYAPVDGRAHGRLDIIVDACDACAEGHKSGPLAGLTVHARAASAGRTCGRAITFAEYAPPAEAEQGDAEDQGDALSASPAADVHPAAVPACVVAYAITRGTSGWLWTRDAVMALRQEPGGVWVAEVDGCEVARSTDLDRLVCALAARTAETLPLSSPILVRSPGERAPQRRPSAAA